MPSPITFSLAPEWIETDGLGGFSMGSSDLLPYRRYHTILSVALTPPTGRIALINLLEMCILSGGKRYQLNQFRFHQFNSKLGLTLPETTLPIEHFSNFPNPKWRYALPSGDKIIFELFRVKDEPTIALSWQIVGTHPYKAKKDTILEVKPLISGRPIHSLHSKNDYLDFTPRILKHGVVWKPYSNLPSIAICNNGEYHHCPDWYQNFRYEEDEHRGYSGVEDLASPGVFKFNLDKGDAILLATASASGSGCSSSPEIFYEIKEKELTRRSILTEKYGSLGRCAENYIVRRGNGSSIIAGYPWFSDWGRDTLIAIRGLSISLKRFDEAATILNSWAKEISAGMLPNTFSDEGAPTLYNSVDAALWFIIGCDSLWSASNLHRTNKDHALVEAIDSILENYRDGTRFNIRADDDGLLACGTNGVQLTWMDAKVGEVVFTPRIGKPVEIQALWINALTIASDIDSKWSTLAEKAANSFKERFWNDELGMLFDVVDVNHIKGINDPAIRPNQLFAIGGLPYQIIDGAQAKSIVAQVEKHLLTPIGIRSLSPMDPNYKGRYEGAQWDRDAAYHQGTVWCWLMGPFVEAWIRVHNDEEGSKESSDIKNQALKRFIEPMLESFRSAGDFAFPEIADGDPPFAPKGAPFQAWTLGEYLRVVNDLLA